VTRLRQRMLDELQRRNLLSEHRSFLHACGWRGSPDISTSRPIHLDPIISAEYQVHLFRDCKLSPRTIEGQTAQRCDFCSLRRLDDPICPTRFRFPSANKRLPAVLSQEEVTRLIDSASSLMHRTMIMTLYATGARRAELCRLVGLRGLLDHCVDHRCWNRDVRPGAGSYFSATPRRPAAEISLATTPPCPG
jgi:integrase/recombinase XerD